MDKYAATEIHKLTRENEQPVKRIQLLNLELEESMKAIDMLKSQLTLRHD